MEPEQQKDLILKTIFEKVGDSSIMMADLIPLLTPSISEFDINSMCDWLSKEGYITIPPTHLQHVQITAKGKTILNKGGFTEKDRLKKQDREYIKKSYLINKKILILTIVIVILTVITLIKTSC